jgi:hypothetical protein
MWLQTLCSIEAGAVSHVYKGGRCLAVALPRRSSRASIVAGRRARCAEMHRDAPRCAEMHRDAELGEQDAPRAAGGQNQYHVDISEGYRCLQSTLTQRVRIIHGPSTGTCILVLAKRANRSLASHSRSSGTSLRSWVICLGSCGRVLAVVVVVDAELANPSNFPH